MARGNGFGLHIFTEFRGYQLSRISQFPYLLTTNKGNELPLDTWVHLRQQFFSPNNALLIFTTIPRGSCHGPTNGARDTVINLFQQIISTVDHFFPALCEFGIDAFGINAFGISAVGYSDIGNSGTGYSGTGYSGIGDSGTGRLSGIG